MKLKLLLFFILNSIYVNAQDYDTLKVMSYNLLNFPATSPERISDLKNIVSYYKPDIFMICELTSGTGATSILNDALNEGEHTSYDMADYIAGPDTENELYFNSDKLGLYSQNTIETVLRDINEYVLYYRSTDIETAVDTTFFYIYVCHLKASSDYYEQRNTEAIVLKEYMAEQSDKENILLGGDFNFYGSEIEPAWNTILNGAGVTLKDPINAPGDWHANAGFGWLHTQSTRTTSFDGGATGGIDDRFDFIFMGEDLKFGTNNAQYINGTYRVIGQDGLHFNKALTDAPINTSAPAYIINSLYQMSDHLPVYMEIAVNRTTLGSHHETEQVLNAFYNAQQQQITFPNWEDEKAEKVFIYSMDGKIVLELNELKKTISVAALKPGCYILRLENAVGTFKFIKP
jgi:endonuclease/exonuclease/phosphatase family metal-dependent hydrolase